MSARVQSTIFEIAKDIDVNHVRSACILSERDIWAFGIVDFFVFCKELDQTNKFAAVETESVRRTRRLSVTFEWANLLIRLL